MNMGMSMISIRVRTTGYEEDSKTPSGKRVGHSPMHFLSYFGDCLLFLVSRFEFLHPHPHPPNTCMYIGSCAWSLT